MLLVSLAACDEHGSRPDETMELRNEGTACFAGGATTPLDFAANEAIDVTVTWDEVCLSSSCTADRVSSCRVEVIGGMMSVFTTATWVEKNSATTACTDDCATFTATCSTEPLAANNYFFEIGGRASVVIQVPSTVTETPCLR